MTEENKLEFTAADESRKFLADELKAKQDKLQQLTIDSSQIIRANLQL